MPTAGTPNVPPGLWTGLPSLELRLECPARPEELRNVRRRLAGLLEECRLPEAVCDGAVLVAAELLTNAYEASPPGSTLRFSTDLEAGVLAIEVGNPLDPRATRGLERFATVGMPAATADRGRGLPLVAALAARLAVTFESGTVRVRAELLISDPLDDSARS